MNENQIKKNRQVDHPQKDKIESDQEISELKVTQETTGPPTSPTLNI